MVELMTQPTDEQAENEVIRAISGLEPMVTGRICDSCNRRLQDGATVCVLLDRLEDGSWSAFRTHCDDCGIEETADVGTNAIAECELGHSTNPEFAPLHNPEVVAVNVAEAA